MHSEQSNWAALESTAFLEIFQAKSDGEKDPLLPTLKTREEIELQHGTRRELLRQTRWENP